jgi:hypothetical protein
MRQAFILNFYLRFQLFKRKRAKPRRAVRWAWVFRGGVLVESGCGVIRLGRYPCRPTRGLTYGYSELWVTRLSCSRARDRRERTVPIGMSNTSAVSW